MTAGGESTTTQISGVTPDYGPVRNANVTEGEFISQEHLLGQASVALLGTEVAEDLFARNAGLVGETVRIEGRPFRVIGVLESKGGSGFRNEDDVILVPLTTAQTRLIRRSSHDNVDMIMVQAFSADTVPSASQEISHILQTRHRTAIGADDFTIFTQQDFLETAQTITSVLTIFLGGIAAISLLVGGIGIMNIMLVSVTERTREIGIMRAIGATDLEIIRMVIVEGLLIGVISFVLAIILAVPFTYLLSTIVSNAVFATPIAVVFTPMGYFIWLGLVIVLSSLASVLPARNAARLTIREVLAYE